MDVVAILIREGLVDEASSASLRGLSLAALVDDEVVAEDALADVLAREAGTIVIDLDRGTLDREAVTFIPDAIARRYLAMAVALEPGGRALRVAFANPLDAAALRDVAESTGRSVRALCAPLSALRRAIEREYGADVPPQVLDVPAFRKELPAEPTRRVEGAPRARTAGGTTAEFAAPDEGTMPVHRLEQEATIEQRHEALLLALIERG